MTESTQTMPDGRAVLVYAKWAWNGYADDTSEYQWRLAAIDRHPLTSAPSIVSVSSNPYVDVAIDPLGWMEAPASPVEPSV